MVESIRGMSNVLSYDIIIRPSHHGEYQGLGEQLSDENSIRSPYGGEYQGGNCHITSA